MVVVVACEGRGYSYLGLTSLTIRWRYTVITPSFKGEGDVTVSFGRFGLLLYFYRSKEKLTVV